jgi:hypothetical protein
MLDKLLNALMWVSDITTRTRDPDLNEYRGYQRRILGWSVVALLLTAAAFFIQPDDLSIRPIFSGLSGLLNDFSLGLAIASLVALLVAFWNGIALYRFVNGHGSHE